MGFKPVGALGAGLAGSLLLHSVAGWLLGWVSSVPSLGFEIQLPSQVEFGIVDGVSSAVPAHPTTPSAEPAAEARSRSLTPGTAPAAPGSTPHAPGSTELAPETEGKRKSRPAPKRRRAKLRKTGTRPSFATRELQALSSPQGAHMALRLDMARIRASPLAQDVRQLLAAVPDWQLVLDGSGVDPVSDLERIFLASPDLQRSHLVIAGSFPGDQSVARAAVARLAQTQGKVVHWNESDRIPTAPWFNRDTTPRVFALLGHHRFAIARAQDVPRLLAVGQALAERQFAAEPGRPRPSADEALLAMAEGSAVELSVEGARRFVRGQTRGIPTRLRLWIAERTPRVGFHAELWFDTPKEARDARQYWDNLRVGYASRPLVVFTGMALPLSEARLTRIRKRLLVETELSFQQLRVLLGFVRGTLEHPRSGTGRTPAARPRRLRDDPPGRQRTGGVHRPLGPRQGKAHLR